MHREFTVGAGRFSLVAAGQTAEEQLVAEVVERLATGSPWPARSPLGEAARLIGGGRSLGREGAAAAMRALLGDPGEKWGEEALAFLLAARPERLGAAELAGLVDAMLSAAVPVEVPAGLLADTCGTGNDSFKTFNVSTAAMPVLAALGVRVAKHGNRAVTSACGSADVLEELGVKIDLDAGGVARCLARTGAAFLFAPRFHPATRRVQGLRRALASLVRCEGRPCNTVFNVLGPLSNPMRPGVRVVGVYDPCLLRAVAGALVELGVERALVVHGSSAEGTLDEISTLGPTVLAEVAGGEVREYRLEPGDFGFLPARPDELRGGDRGANAALLRELLQGGGTPAARELVAVNAGAVLYLAGQARTFAEGAAVAAAVLATGAAWEKLGELVEASHAQ